MSSHLPHPEKQVASLSNSSLPLPSITNGAPSQDMNSLVHAELDISAAGLTQPPVFPLDSEGSPMEPENVEELFPEPEAPLRPISDDKRPMEEKETALLAELGKCL